jgi:hypothetical protein
VFIRCARLAAGLDAEIWRDESSAISEVGNIDRVVSSSGFPQVFDDESTGAQSSDQVFESVQVFCGPFFAVGLIGHAGQWSLVVVFKSDHKLLTFIAVADLQADGLFVL